MPSKRVDSKSICSCGCGRECKKRYVHGHNNRNKKRSPETISKLIATLKTPCIKAKHKAGAKLSANRPEFKKALRDANLGKRLSKEHRDKISKANSGKVRDPEVAKELREKLRLIRIGQAGKKKETKIEKILYEFLSSGGVIFEKQKPIGSFIVDAYVPEINLVIEADGNYWHGTPRGLETDARKNLYLTKNNFKLIRLTETEILNSTFKERLKTKLNIK